jgi:hypothetical protein
MMGAFAAMAQNSYGLTILGGVSVAFGVIFLIQFINRLRKKGIAHAIKLVEYSSLVLLSFILALRIFHIQLPYMEWVFTLSGLALAYNYLNRLIKAFGFMKTQNHTLSILILTYYLSLIIFIIALVIMPFMQVLAFYAGCIAVILLISFLVAGFLKKQFLVDGQAVSAIGAIAQLRDQSILLLSLFFLFSLYLGFSTSGILPKIYSDEDPQAYFELVNKAETGNEKPINGKYKFEAFKTSYDQFVDKDITTKAK